MKTITIEELNKQMAAVCDNLFECLTHRKDDTKEGYKNYLYDTEVGTGEPTEEGSWTNDVAHLYKSMVIARMRLGGALKNSPMFINGFGLIALGLAADCYVKFMDNGQTEDAEAMRSILKIAGDKYMAHRTKFGNGKVKFVMPNFGTILETDSFLDNDTREILENIIEEITEKCEESDKEDAVVNTEETTNNNNEELKMKTDTELKEELIEELKRVKAERDEVLSKCEKMEEVMLKQSEVITEQTAKLKSAKQAMKEASETLSNTTEGRFAEHPVLTTLAITVAAGGAAFAGYWLGNKIAEYLGGE